MGDAILRKGFQFKLGYPNPSDWETPICAFCKSTPDAHHIVFKNVQQGEIDLVECNICELRFYSPRPKYNIIRSRGYGTDLNSKAQAEFFYENISFQKVDDRQSQLLKIESYYENLLRNVIDLVGFPISIFEVGGLIGVFLETAKKMGVTQLGGCELNPWAVKIAKENFGLLDCEAGDFNLYVPRKFDWECGVMLDVIEHVYYPFDDLKKISSMTRKGGSLLLKTFLEELDINRTMEAPMGHFYHFKRKTLQRMIEEAGYDIKKWTEEEMYAQVLTVAVKI